jgi:hypothetical protein
MNPLLATPILLGINAADAQRDSGLGMSFDLRTRHDTKVLANRGFWAVRELELEVADQDGQCSL